MRSLLRAVYCFVSVIISHVKEVPGITASNLTSGQGQFNEPDHVGERLKPRLRNGAVYFFGGNDLTRSDAEVYGVHLSEMGAEFRTLEDKAGIAKPIMALCDHPSPTLWTPQMLSSFSWQGFPRGAEPLGTGLHIYSA